jgi:uncharacterized protein (TIGR01777 family)
LQVSGAGHNVLPEGIALKVLVTGATGLVGRELCAQLTGPVVLSRDAARAERELGGGVRAFAWQPETGPAPAAAFEGVDTVFHLAGEPVAAGRWTAEKKRRIRDSRVLGTRQLVAALEGLPALPRVLVCASAVGYYGNRGDEELPEAAGKGTGFLADVCEAWEAEARAAERYGVRVVLARLGLVLAPGGGALARMLPPFKLGLGGKLGDGRQWMPWVHVADVVGLLLHAARDERSRGPMNVVGPEPVTNAELTRELGRVLGRPAVFPVPRLALRAVFGELSEVLLESQRVIAGVASETHYTFRYPRLGPALEACVRG